MKIDRIKRFSSKSDISNEELLYLNYAEKLGLKLEYLDYYFKYIESNKYYKIQGFIWKYTKINMIDGYINNELYLHLEYDPTYKKTEEENNLLNQTSSSNNLIQNIICGSENQVDLNGISSNYMVFSNSGYIAITGTSYSMYDEINELKNIVYNSNNILNPLISEPSSFNKYISISEFNNNFLLNEKQINIPILNQKFKIIIF